MQPPDMIRVEISVGDELLRLAVRNGARVVAVGCRAGRQPWLGGCPTRRGVATLPSLLSVRR